MLFIPNGPLRLLIGFRTLIDPLQTRPCSQDRRTQAKQTETLAEVCDGYGGGGGEGGLLLHSSVPGDRARMIYAVGLTDEP